ncbi:MAG: helix-turn-helix transcriptional regulator [Clostridiaceae bacterium]|jgi:transcriptional regulator with XRE-family HTH domain|nr:helix-turn-helix transcriptional regulator [Clostridiaceae bacterium]
MDTKDFYIKLSSRIKFLRENAHLTQEQLAEKADLSLDFLGKLEINYRKPSLRTIVKLANALKIEPFEILKF